MINREMNQTELEDETMTRNENDQFLAPVTMTPGSPALAQNFRRRLALLHLFWLLLLRSFAACAA